VGSTITGKEAARKVPVFHPRAAELCNLFDDSLLRWCRKTLSGDPQALAEACQAIQDVPHDWLVKAAVTRCGKTIGSPRSVPAICKEIHHNWSRGKALPEAHRIVSAAEIDAIVAKERAELAAQRRQYALDTRERMRRERERNR
jgi:hypothetical protein